MEIRANGLKVYLKSLGIEDADQIAAKANDYEVAYNIAEWGSFPHPYQKSDALTFIENATRALAEGREVHLGIRMAETNELIGVLGLKEISAKNKKAEVGFWIGKSYWHKGYSTQAVSMIVEYGFEKLKLNKITANVFAFNEASVRLLQKLGFVREGLLRDNILQKDDFVDSMLFGILKKEYKSNVSINVR